MSLLSTIQMRDDLEDHSNLVHRRATQNLAGVVRERSLRREPQPLKHKLEARPVNQVDFQDHPVAVLVA